MSSWGRGVPHHLPSSAGMPNFRLSSVMRISLKNGKTVANTTPMGTPSMALGMDERRMGTEMR
jgi:hypothetical protein